MPASGEVYYQFIPFAARPVKLFLPFCREKAPPLYKCFTALCLPSSLLFAVMRPGRRQSRAGVKATGQFFGSFPLQLKRFFAPLPRPRCACPHLLLRRDFARQRAGCCAAGQGQGGRA
ncbi:MAG: hypothetical protein DU429_04280 [Candidatus Tokpelaia sp.]|nr:MAG: hypothetical protein DU430_06095 [Candidatus Tokpelaia sp.]KAA6207066.1 MAG: hypothetical protein DU429_04280 [Candidatus Tokpelaia sp.]